MRVWAPLFLLIIIASDADASTRFAALGDYGFATPAESQVASIIQSWHPDFVITTGDNSYGSNSIDFNIGQYFSAYIGNYQGSYGPGSFTNRFFPSPGNHDYSDGGGFGSYLSYFALPGANIPTTGTSGNPRYYDFIRGPVHFFVLNSNYQETDGTTPNSVQGIWLQTQLAASQVPWKIVYMHHPPYSSSQHGSTPGMQWPFEAWGASIVMTGHDHTYEPIKRDDNNDSDSLTYIVTGLGGRSIYSFPASNLVTGSVIRYNANYGANLIEASDSTLSVRFINISGVTVDSFLLTRPSTCCTGTTGNLNGLGDVDLLDLSAMVSFLLHHDYQFACSGEANLDKHGGIDLTDLSYLISYLQGVMTPLPNCP